MSKQFVSYSMVLMVLFSVLLVVPKTEAQQRCSKELEPGTECLLSKCREDCFKQLSGFGSCIENPIGSSKYTCNCFYNCLGAPSPSNLM
ncbi:hypothetical protein EUTSA_v10005578mg [Eutrema salsugineum]|uniref:Knottin scorpion toxin-like domain-containing protein n=1 Tax=Eutrema salsugineum TaxID=72664 RepID=V4KQZ5_EUTSA|nr:putative defensin-like protein 165 [Eutrema salsugineum]ESQ32422.1 hypothetical protein EUTSA_v10005578mg [Eutrema salsugineum]